MDNDLLYFRESGTDNDKTLILLHGLFGNSLNFSGIIEDLSKQFHVICLDLRNHGKSFHNDYMDYEVMAEDVADFIDRQNIHPYAMIGHSMGGKVLMAYLLKQLRYYNELIPIVMDIFPNTSPSENLIKISNVLYRVDLNIEKSRDDIFRKLYRVEPNQQIIAFLLTNLISVPKFFWRINVESIYKNIDRLISFPAFNSNFDKPVHLLYGELSPYFSLQSKSDMLKLFSKTQFYCVPDANHWVHVDQKKAVISILNSII